MARVAGRTVDRDEALEFFRTLVMTPSVTAHERELAELIVRWAEGIGIETQVIETTPDSPNVLLWLRGDGTGPTLMIHGHMDTVPEYGGWTVDPWGGLVRGGRLYGHGIRDQKTGLAAQLVAAWDLFESRVPLKGDLCVANVCMHTGSQYIMERKLEKGTETIVKKGIRADFAVVTEPTGYRVCVAQRGPLTLEIRTRGRAAHTTSVGVHRGINAVVKMAKIILALDGRRLQADARIAEEVARLLPGPACYLNVGPVRGGVERNIVPDACELLLDIRFLPGVTREEIVREITGVIESLKAEDPEIAAQITEKSTATRQDPYAIPSSHPLVTATRMAVEQTFGRSEVAGINAWTDASILAAAGIPSVICGPTDEPWYGADSWADLELDFYQGVHFFKNLANLVCGKSREEFDRAFRN